MFSDEIPFANIHRDTHVLLYVLTGARPPRPTAPDKIGFTAQVWALIEDGWNAFPGKRPSLTAFLNTFAPPGSACVSITPAPDNKLNIITAVHRSFQVDWAITPRVLLVEHDTVVRNLWNRFLQVFGCTVDLASDGQEAIDKMSAAQYDLVLMSILMPNMNGVTATSTIRRFNAWTPIIAMTSATKPQDLARYFTNGINDVLPKPFSKETMFDVLEVCFSSLSDAGC
jgi:CheY-like chemotaxis protein